MADALKLGFGPFAAPARIGASGVLVVFCDDGLKFGPATARAIAPAAGLVARAAKAERFTGKSGSALELVVPEGLKVSRLVVIGVGKTKDLEQKDLLKLGGLAMGKLPVSASEATRVRGLAGRRDEGRSGRRPGARHRAARLRLRPLQDQAQGRREAAGPAQRDGRGRRRRRRTQGLCGARSDQRRRADGARSRQRAGQCALPGGIRPPHGRSEEGRRRGRGARPQGDEETRHERAARRRPGLGAREPRRGDALERRQSRRGAGRLHRQGRVLRHRRHFDQAGGRRWRT